MAFPVSGFRLLLLAAGLVRCGRGGAAWDADGVEGVVVVASIDGGQVPVRIRYPAPGDQVLDDALAAVERHGLSRRAVAACAAGDAPCVAALFAAEAAVAANSTACRLRVVRPRDREVTVLADISLTLVVELRFGSTWRAMQPFRGRLFADIVPNADGDDRNPFGRDRPLSGWMDVADEDVGSVTVKFAARRPDFSPTPKVRGELLISLTAKIDDHDCGWVHATLRVGYRPFTDPDPPRSRLARAELRGRLEASAVSPRCAFATLLYDDANGYAHGAVALVQSLRETRTAHAVLCLVGRRVRSNSRAALAAMGAELVDVDSDDASFADKSSALPALGFGQWAKLRLWELARFDRVLYLDADALVLRNVDEVFFALGDAAAPDFAAVDEYFVGASFLLRPDSAERARLERTAARDAGRYVYGEQDFLNVHVAGAHAPLAEYYLCNAEIVSDAEYEPATGAWANRCGIVEFASCAAQSYVAWKPWHGARELVAGRKVCLRVPNANYLGLVSVWEAAHARALRTLEAAGAEPPDAYAAPVANFSAGADVFGTIDPVSGMLLL